MFEDIGTWLTQARTLAALAFLCVIVVLAVATAWKTKSTPAVLGVLAGGILALAILVKMDALALKVGGELDGTRTTTVNTGSSTILGEFGGTSAQPGAGD